WMESLETRQMPTTAAFSASTYSVNEYTSSVTITVNLSGQPGTPVTVQYSTADGTALSSSDYASTNGTLNFGSTDTSKTFSVPITNDLLIEGNETFTVALSSPSPNPPLSLGAPSSATVTIVDNDLLGLTEFSVPTSNSGVLNLTKGPDGLIWFTENSANKIGK